MRILWLLLVICFSLVADIRHEMLDMYSAGKYKEVCKKGFDNFIQNKKDEEFVSLYAFGCLKSDYIDRLTIPVALLKYSKEARANSAYFSVILMQKKLLYHALIDKYDLASLNLPTTDYVLSKVFDLYVELGKHESKPYYIFKDKQDKHLTYKLYLLKEARLNKMVIEEFYDTIPTKRHIYW
jgi:hypothetical protein